ncbi:MAG: sulfatase-like hydrolase/transferase, partial [Melioribacteraceae bacterium]|nr:sulfatase-like hydrolase/transferase [Melioribacteraceae bacterium]
GPVDCEPEEFRDGHYVSSVENFFSEEHSDPFFLAIGFHAPHVKFAVPKQFFDMYDINEIVIPDNPSNDLEDMPRINSKTAIHSVLDSSQWRDIKLAQFACISYVDWCIGTVVESIKKNNLDKNTVIVVWTDHGFMLGEHYQWSKGGNKLFEETTKVGLIWKVPGITPESAYSNGIVETIDIFPTLFDLCNISIPDYVEGESFVSLLKEPSRRWKKAAITWGTRQRVSVQTERFRLNTDIDLDPNSFELYDHNYDPKEHINLSCNPQYRDTIELLLTYYKNHHQKDYLLGN